LSVADEYVNASEARERAAWNLARWRLHPTAFVIEELGVQPDPWQIEVLEAFPSSPRLAMKACKGPGKSATLSWLILNFLVTRPFPKIAVTSITGGNLKDGLWAELGKWMRRSKFMRRTFDYAKERITYKPDADNWFVSARQWSRSADQEQMEGTLAGLHAEYILIVVDEAGGVPDAVVAAAEGALASGTEMHLVIAGNPTHNEGPLWRACTTERDLWKLFTVTGDPDDPNRAPRVDRQWALDQISKYGKNSPWVQVNVYGNFPTATTEGLITIQQMMDSRDRIVDRFGAPLSREGRTLGLDVARQGVNLNVLTYREGDFIDRVDVWHGQDIVQTSGRARTAIDDFNPDCLYVDDIGIGGGVTDILLNANQPVFPVNVGETATEPDKHINLRSELAHAVQTRFRDGKISIASRVLDETSLMQEATTLRAKFDERTRRKIEKKEEYKRRAGRSPDHWDSLVLTHAGDGGIGVGASSEDGELRRGSMSPFQNRADADTVEVAAGEWAPRRTPLRLR